MALGLVFSGASASASAQEAAADALFTEGRAEYDVAHHEEALALFRQAYASSGSPVAHLYVARTLRALHRGAEAADEYARVIAEAEASTEVRYQRVRQSALAELEELRGQLVAIELDLTGLPPGAEVHVGGRRVTTLRPLEHVFAEPGSIEIVASAPGHHASTETLVASAGMQREVALHLAPLVNHLEAPSSSPHDTTLLVASGVSLGGGIAALLSGAALEIAAELRHQELDQACAMGCPIGVAARAAEGQTFELAGRTLLGVGFVFTVVGVVGIVVNTTAGEANAQTVEVDGDSVTVHF